MRLWRYRAKAFLKNLKNNKKEKNKNTACKAFVLFLKEHNICFDSFQIAVHVRGCFEKVKCCTAKTQ